MSRIANTPGKGKEPAPPTAPVPKPRPVQAMETKGAPRHRKKGAQAISRRITRVAMLVSMAGLTLAGLVFFSCDLYSHYAATRSSISTLARVAAENVRTPLALGYVETVASTLEAITAESDITGAAVYRVNGQSFARATGPKSGLPMTVSNVVTGPLRDLPYLRHYEPIMHRGQRLGTVVIESTLAPLYRRLGTYGIITLATLGAAWLVARILAERLQRAISGPVVELAAVAEKVGTGRDFGIRAVKRAEDEVGDLVEAFNNMLGEIQRRDEDIRQAQVDLEMNVLARTSELHQQIEDRKLAQAAMRDSELRYRNLFESNPMPMFVIDLESLDFIAVNNSAIRHYGYSEAEFLRLSLPSITHDTDPLEVTRVFRSAAKSMDTGEWKHRLRNGSVIEVHITAHAIVLAGSVAKIVLANDVTERNRAQREVEALHKKLVAASRQAGMAEIATGVLHNVGNVLNSVNVSAVMLADGTQQTKAAGIRKVAELLQEHAGDLAAFFAEGGKGRKLPQYLASLAGQLEREQQERLAEIDVLTKNVEHIKQIVVTQQDYAKAADVLGQYAPLQLVEDGLKMAEAEFARDRVKTVIEAQAGVPDVVTDRHKVLQILLNLFTNARQAMEQIPAEERCVTIRITHERNQVRLIVEDVGCGIPAENLTRIFNLGFTTKKDGHGFGLHSSANAAHEMGGSLGAESKGRGAVFTLALPAKAVPSKKAAVAPVPKA